MNSDISVRIELLEKNLYQVKLDGKLERLHGFGKQDGVKYREGTRTGDAQEDEVQRGGLQAQAPFLAVGVVLLARVHQIEEQGDQGLVPEKEKMGFNFTNQRLVKFL